MKNYYIPKYGEFRCIAGACPDSCCAGWEIEVDETTAEGYLNEKGALEIACAARLAANRENISLN